MGHDYAKSAIDTACWDALGRAVGRACRDLLGGRLVRALPALLRGPAGLARGDDRVRAGAPERGHPPLPAQDRRRSVRRTPSARKRGRGDRPGGHDRRRRQRGLAPPGRGRRGTRDGRARARLTSNSRARRSRNASIVRKRTTLPMVLDECVPACTRCCVPRGEGDGGVQPQDLQGGRAHPGKADAGSRRRARLAGHDRGRLGRRHRVGRRRHISRRARRRRRCSRCRS